MTNFNRADINYWNTRARDEYYYNGEKFYTITPVPYYYARRNCIVSLLAQLAYEIGAKDILDYGCGTGEYLCKLHAAYSLNFGRGWGVDCSSSMLEIAQRNCTQLGMNINFMLNDSGILGIDMYDMIYVVAVFAHIDDDQVLRILRNFREHLRSNGSIAICEQVGGVHIEGETYRRRTVKEYEQLLAKAGFTLKKQKLIDFWVHRIFFERRLAKLIYRYCFSGTDHDRRILANKTWWFRLLSTFFTRISWPRLFNKSSGFGYAFIVANP